MKFFMSILVMLLIVGSTPSTAQETSRNPNSVTGFLVAAPDRGAMGNNRAREAFKTLSEHHLAQLVFITDEDSAKYVDQALNNLKAKGATKAVVLPLFLSQANPKFVLLSQFVSNRQDILQSINARAFGDSYLAVEMLAERFKRLQKTTVAVIAGNGSTTTKNHEAMTNDLKRIVQKAQQGVFKGEVKTIVWPVRGSDDYKTLDEQSWKQLKETQGQVQVLPFNLGQELDSMMSFSSQLKWGLPEGVKLLTIGDDEPEWTSLWMQREANRYTAFEKNSVGIVFHAHGSSFHWNQGMRDATKELAKKYPIEYAFSMADAPSLRHAVKRLEERGIGAIVIVRVFGMESSFRESIEKLLGMDVEMSTGGMDMASHGGGHGAMNMGRVPRLKTSSIVVSVGGLQDNALFAEALLDRAKALSKEASKETVIVVAHGQGRDSVNDAWLKILASITEQMKQKDGHDFRDIQYQTWREDWPDKSVSRVLSVKEMVVAAQLDGGTALIIPARTTGQGPAETFLKGMDYRVGSGFAPHPLFPKWIEQQFHKGTAMIHQSRDLTPVMDSAHHAK